MQQSTLNFFEHQDQARQNTLYLLVLFAIALLGMIGLFYLASTIALFRRLTWQPGILVLVSFGVMLFVGAGSISKLIALRGGGRVVAEGLGGHRLGATGVPNEAEQQLLNVVEEMAIAAGVSVPAVYLLPQERSINAFAAGFTTNDAVIGITQGCLDQLSRDELQGVIAHEFSHILNGDMRLNLRLMGVLQGILLIYLAGRLLLEGSGHSRSDKGGNQLAVAGFAMIAVGMIGLLCGRLIKSAVSRQREFLADASAVQFTRNPHGIAGALRKIGGLGHSGSLIQSPKAEQASHLFFGEALKLNFFGEAFATHPALKTRIRRLEGLAGKVSTFSESTTAMPRSGSLSGMAGGAAMGFQGGTPSATKEIKVTPEEVVASIGTATEGHLIYAKALLAKLPESVHTAAHQREGALAIVYGLLLDGQDQGVRDRQIAFLKQTELPDVVEQALRLQPDLQKLDPRFRLPLIELTIPALRETSAEQCSRFLKQVQALVQMDQRVTLAEYSLQVVLHRRLKSFFSQNQEPGPEITTIGPLWKDCLTILSALARVGHTTSDQIDYAFRSGLYRLPGVSSQEMPSGPVKADLQAISQSLKKLGQAAPKLKQAIIDACAHTVLVDNKVTIQEGELLRVLVIAMDCPIPPFLDSTPWQKG
ncbi:MULTISPECIES: M48 family metallopeptidase [unclassified Leptolyngbya]|uniref:M48 family metallopeptidase n=1 Tax=unclassified Leptolyngbya TaxID=2650499 RepID=UPI001683749B|nr:MULTISPECIES: M48 family metallopeptidase [unclassified Leptolyngbya]MBD1910235.1 M48 family metalloprotease [Leptolyngbya sp. FACHB-8]MBD2156442.1 M48 family metalloprotease [Leptolyngbya sp. FACHB-16]